MRHDSVVGDENNSPAQAENGLVEDFDLLSEAHAALLDENDRLLTQLSAGTPAETPQLVAETLEV